ncbi:phosphatase PAP2 family protein [Robiginitalea marina]|uniref:Phosphatase PAP2 family protein n=1 Tax=Robiginitalea marina TaxID=2954105 RepID=A0ABT1AYS0_9FLAO|nr:phosphatase PAP2 family protein [Robiginitalea marina]MCO5724829.1 phosphatase PAP2 family protein [Robiginitalea marina]
MLEQLLLWDREAFLYLNNLGVAPLDPFWSTVTDIAPWTPLFVLFLALLLRAYPLKQAVAIALTAFVLLGVVLWFTDWTKAAVARLRPNQDLRLRPLARILRDAGGYSFFSGHASSSFSIATLMFIFLQKHFRAAFLFFLWPLLFASSRIFVGVHYPLDVLVGALAGIAFGALFYSGHQRFILPYIR